MSFFPNSGFLTLPVSRGGTTPPAPTAAPVNIAPPQIAGTPQLGETLTATLGAWINSPTSYTRQWYRDGVAISGATGATYAPVEADVGKTITHGVIAANAIGGSAEAISAGVGPIEDAPVEPVLPGSIEDLTATAQSDSEVLLEWTPAADATSQEYCVDGGVWTACDDNSGEQLVSGLTAETEYAFQVRGVNADGAGPASSIATATTEPAPIAEPNVLSEGDSISASTEPASFTRLWAADHPTVVYANHAVGGAQLGFPGDTLPANTLYARQADALAYEPTHLVLLIGANDLAGDTTAYVSRLYAYLAPFRAAGTTIVLCTVLPRDSSGWQDKMGAFNARVRLDEGTEFDFLVDFATSEAGAWGAQLDAAFYGDGLHPTAAGHALLKRVFAPVINHALGIPNEPLDFAFEPQAAADADTDYDSAPYTVAGLYPGETRPYSVSAGGAISRNGGAYINDGSGTVVNGDTISVRNHSSADPAVQTDVTATIGTTSATYSVTTAGAGSRLWAPSDLGSKLALWLRPEDITGADGSQMNGWPDASGNNVAVTGAGSSSKPVVEAGGLNGFNIVKFAGALQGRFDLPSDYLSGRSACSTFFVSKNNADPNTSKFAPPVGRFGTNSSGEFYPYNNGNVYSAHGTNTRYQISAARPSLAEWRFASFQSAANDWRYYVDGSAVHTLIANTVAFGTTPAIGAGYYNDYFDGQLAEVIDCNEALTTTERQLIEGYLAWKFGLQANLPSGHPYEGAAPTISD